MGLPFLSGRKTKKEQPLQVSVLPLHSNGKKCAASKKRAAPSASPDGSLAVEAALALWLFILFVVCLMMPMEFVRVSLRVQKALEEELRFRCINFSAEEPDQSARLHTGEETYLDPESWGWLDASCVEGGREGMRIRCEEDGERVELDVGYYVQIPFSIAGTRTFYLQNSCSGRIWNGLSVFAFEVADTVGDTVFITPYGETFHWYRDCVSLDVTVQEITGSTLETVRNADGSKYYPCRYCCGDGKDIEAVFITKYGTRYHEDRQCSRLCRTVLAVSPQEAAGRRLCEKCRARKEEGM